MTRLLACLLLALGCGAQEEQPDYEVEVFSGPPGATAVEPAPVCHLSDTQGEPGSYCILIKDGPGAGLHCFEEMFWSLGTNNAWVRFGKPQWWEDRKAAEEPTGADSPRILYEQLCNDYQQVFVIGAV